MSKLNIFLLGMLVGEGITIVFSMIGGVYG